MCSEATYTKYFYLYCVFASEKIEMIERNIQIVNLIEDLISALNKKKKHILNPI